MMVMMITTVMLMMINHTVPNKLCFFLALSTREQNEMSLTMQVSPILVHSTVAKPAPRSPGWLWVSSPAPVTLEASSSARCPIRPAFGPRWAGCSCSWRGGPLQTQAAAWNWTVGLGLTPDDNPLQQQAWGIASGAP